MVILDTSIIIDHLRNQKSSTPSLLIRFVTKYPEEILALSVISIQELYEGKSTLITKKENELLAILSPLKILLYDYQTAKLAGTIARDISSPLELADCAIGATAIINDCKVLTLNTKDFAKMAEVSLYDLKNL